MHAKSRWHITDSYGPELRNGKVLTISYKPSAIRSFLLRYVSRTIPDFELQTTPSSISVLRMLIVMVMIVTRFLSRPDRLWFQRSESGSIRILFR